MKRLSASMREAEMKRRAEEERKTLEREEQQRLAEHDFQVFLESKFEEFKVGYPTLQRFEQLSTGHDPFCDVIARHGRRWMLEPNHKHYQSQKSENWDPRKILEWGQTYIEKYMCTAEPE